MPKKGRKNLKIVEIDSNIEISKVLLAIKVKTVYKDTRAVTGAEPELKWGQI